MKTISPGVTYFLIAKSQVGKRAGFTGDCDFSCFLPNREGCYAVTVPCTIDTFLCQEQQGYRPDDPIVHPFDPICDAFSLIDQMSDQFSCVDITTIYFTEGHSFFDQLIQLAFLYWQQDQRNISQTRRIYFQTLTVEGPYLK